MKYVIISLLIVVALVTLTPGKSRTYFIHGYVTNANTSDPIDSARVHGSCILSPRTFDVYTDINGYYEVLDSLTPGSWDVTASHRYYKSQTRTLNLPTQTLIIFSLDPR